MAEVASEISKKNIVLIGNPNTGKSTVFNALTGLNQKVGNFPGVTVDKKTGRFQYKGTTFNLVDLPGSYSLKANSQDEEVARDYILTQTNKDDIVVVVADATNLKRNLLLLTELLDQNKHVVLALNMMDLLQKNQSEINLSDLSKALNCPIIPLNARIGKGIDKLKEVLYNYKAQHKPFLNETPNSALKENEARMSKIQGILDQCVTHKGEDKAFEMTKKIDHILTHPIYGYGIFLGLLFLIFQAIFSWASYPMDLIESGFIFLSELVASALPQGVLNDLIVNGIIAGLGGIVIFVPQIAILFAFITIMEETGYMARVSFLMDRILRSFGLNGKSIIPLLSSTACAVPAIMSARTIGNYKEKLITIMVAPLMSCSARIPVYTILIALIVPADKTIGPFNMQGVMVLGLYLLGFAAALLSAWVMKLLIKAKERSSFTLEMPVYRSPRWKNVGLEILNKVKVFVFDAGKIIIAISILLWALSSYGPGDKIEQIEANYAQELLNNPTPELQAQVASEKLEASYAGVLGKAIEPAIEPIGYDWKIGIALITSFAAREVFVGTMATLYSVGNEDNTKSIRQKLMAAKKPGTNEPLYSLATTLSLLIFYVFAMQCMATLAVVYRETNSIKWSIIQILYMGVLAYGGSLIVYHLFS